MRKKLLKLTCGFIATIWCINVNAQSRIKKNYISDDGFQNNQSVLRSFEGGMEVLQKKGGQTFLPSSLSGYYFEGFESAFPPAGWQIVDVLDNVNTWTSSTLADYPDAFEGAQAAYCHYAYPVGPGEDWFISPKFTVAAGDSLMFQFKWESIGWQYDSTLILISTTDSALSSFSTLVDSYVDTSTVQILNVPDWYYKSYSLNAFTGQDIYVAFVNKNTNGDGVFIDNVELGTRPVAEVAVKSIDMDRYYPTGTSNPKASVKNYGSITQTFDVTMTINGGYTSTKSVTVSPQATTQISFDPWYATVGNYTINVQTLLTGDVNSANDTISKSINVLESFVNYGWSTHDPLVAPVMGSAAVSVCTNTNSSCFLMGGIATGNILVDANKYDLSFGTWAGISPMTVKSCFAGAAHANGKIFVLAGTAFTNGNPDGTTKIYDYVTDTWSTGTPMPIPVANCAFGTYKDSLIFIIGGNIGNAVASNNVQIYNTYTDVWSVGTAKPGTPVYAIRAGIAGNKIVVTGGYDPAAAISIGTTYVGAIDSVDPTEITWTQMADHPAGKISRTGPGVSLDKNSSLVVFAGGTNTNTTATTTAKTFAYDVNSNAWKIGPDKPTPLNLFYMTPVVQNDSLYLAALGGNDGVNESDKNEWLNLGFYQFPIGIEENNFVAEVNLFPNPASDATTLSLNLKNASQVKITISDVIGNTVMIVCDKKMDAGKNSISISSKNLESGMYFCAINVDGKTITKKIIKN
ncbi:MAG TPA: choice-of-anchor J domain-containing protein [Bacteroidia bacterium]|nr:choice-of-anchor J domain-containing protein [Bacteroidia bacterium]